MERDAFRISRIEAYAKLRIRGGVSRETREASSHPVSTGDAAAASDGAQSDGAQSESDALNIEVNKEDLLGSVFAKVSGSHTSYLVVVEPPPSCRLKTNQVAAVQFNAWGRAFVAQEHVVVRKSVKSLVTTYCLVHHGLLFTGRQLFCVIDAGEVTEHIRRLQASVREPRAAGWEGCSCCCHGRD